MLMAFLAIVLTLLLVIGVHEAGHALAARIFSVRIKKVSIGFGKPLLAWHKTNGCVWVWAMWPLGGYVQLANNRIAQEPAAEQAYCFDKKPVWIRISILLAGAAVNLLTAWLAFVLVFYIGLNQRVAQIEAVIPNSIAAQAGIVAGDRFVGIADRRANSWQAVGQELVIGWGQAAVAVELLTASGVKKNTLLDLSGLKFTEKDRNLLTALGIKANPRASYERIAADSLIHAMGLASQELAHISYFFVMVIKKLVTGVIPFSLLLGPIGLFAASINSLTQGLVVFLSFIATLSMAVAWVNLIPLPGLDGGSIVYALIEKIRGKPVSVAMEVLLHRLVVIVFVLVLVQLVMNDLNRLAH